MSGSNSSNGAKPRRKGRRRRKSKKSESVKATEFWGAESASVDGEHQVVVAQVPTAVLESLGPLPLGSHRTAGEAYFQVIYGRAAVLSGALGAAGDLVDDPED